MEWGLQGLKWETCLLEPWALVAQGQSEPGLGGLYICAKAPPGLVAEGKTGGKEPGGDGRGPHTRARLPQPPMGCPRHSDHS